MFLPEHTWIPLDSEHYQRLDTQEIDGKQQARLIYINQHVPWITTHCTCPRSQNHGFSTTQPDCRYVRNSVAALEGQDRLANRKINQLSHILFNDPITKFARLHMIEQAKTPTAEELEWLVGQHSRV